MLAMTGRYVEKDADPLQRAADAVANRIAAAMKGKERGSRNIADESRLRRGGRKSFGYTDSALAAMRDTSTTGDVAAMLQALSAERRSPLP